MLRQCAHLWSKEESEHAKEGAAYEEPSCEASAAAVSLSSAYVARQLVSLHAHCSECLQSLSSYGAA